MNIVDKNVDEIIPYENNPRKNDKAVPGVAKSIQEFGFKVPIIIDKNNVVVCGHTRLKAAKKLGLRTVPCVVAADLSPEKIRPSGWPTTRYPNRPPGTTKSSSRN